MIQATTETGISIYIQTEDNRINTSVASTHIRHLMKFTNDMDGAIHYYYATNETIYNRYTYLTFTYNTTTDMFEGVTNLLPAGYWKYEAYEVSWGDELPSVVEGKAPKTEDDVLTPPAANKGIVQGLVTKGKMYLAERDGTAQVQYRQRKEPSETNYIWYGQ